jgi:integrase
VSARWGGWDAERLAAADLDDAYLAMLTGKAGKRVYRRGEGTTATAQPMSARSVEAVHKTIKAAYALAVEQGLLVRNPAALATPPAVVDQRRAWWAPEQVGAFLSFVAGRDDVPAGLVEVMADTGGRRGEVLGLRWGDVDLDAGTATIRRQLTEDPATGTVTARPTKRPRAKARVALHPSTVAALRRRRAQQGADRLLMRAGWPGPDSVYADLVFTWPHRRAIRPPTLTRMVARWSVEAGLPRLTPHGLRHSFAMAAISACVPVEVAAGSGTRRGSPRRCTPTPSRRTTPGPRRSSETFTGLTGPIGDQRGRAGPSGSALTWSG